MGTPAHGPGTGHPPPHPCSHPPVGPRAGVSMTAARFQEVALEEKARAGPESWPGPFGKDPPGWGYLEPGVEAKL